MPLAARQLRQSAALTLSRECRTCCDVPNEVAAELAGDRRRRPRRAPRPARLPLNLRGNRLTLDGDDLKVAEARAVVEELVDLVESGQEVGAGHDRHGAQRDRPGRGRPRHLRGRRLVAPRQADHAEDRDAEALRRRDPPLHRHVRDRPRRHRQDVSRDRARRRGAVRAAGRPHHPHAAGGRGGRAARLPARATCSPRSTRTCGRCSTRSTTRCDPERAERRTWSAARSRSRRSRSCAAVRSRSLERRADAGRPVRPIEQRSRVDELGDGADGRADIRSIEEYPQGRDRQELPESRDADTAGRTTPVLRRAPAGDVFKVGRIVDAEGGTRAGDAVRSVGQPPPGASGAATSSRLMSAPAEFEPREVPTRPVSRCGSSCWATAASRRETHAAVHDGRSASWRKRCASSLEGIELPAERLLQTSCMLDVPTRSRRSDRRGSGRRRRAPRPLGCRVNLRGTEADARRRRSETVAEARRASSRSSSTGRERPGDRRGSDRHVPNREDEPRTCARDLRGRRLVAPRQRSAEDGDQAYYVDAIRNGTRHLRDRPGRHRQDVSSRSRSPWRSSERQVGRIILRPAVEAGERRGSYRATCSRRSTRTCGRFDAL